MWEFHNRHTQEVFGCCWADLPRWLADDLVSLVGMRAWHEINKELPKVDVSKLPSIEDL